MTRYKLSRVRICGAICGHMWVPASMGSTGYRTIDVERALARFSDASDATMRDVVLSTLLENGGDFQDARFSGDTTVDVTRVRTIRGGGSASHTRSVPLSKWPECADLVHADTFSNDFGSEE